MMSTIEKKCKEKGVRLTDQRKVIAKILSESKEIYGSKDHPDVDELHKRVTNIDDKKREEMLSHRQIWTHRLMACMTRSYKQAALNTMVVGSVIGELVKHIDNKIDNQWSHTTLCIGLSLGAHTCGFIGKSSNMVINLSNCFSTIILFETLDDLI